MGAAAFAVSVDALDVRLGATQVLGGLCFGVAEGERVVLLGPNGAGKTTLLRCLAGLLTPHSGEIVLGTGLRPHQPEARGLIGYVGHRPRHYEDLTAVENLRFTASLYRVQCARDRIEDLLRSFGLWDVRMRRSRELSRGMQQRLALAAVLLPSPGLLLLDEPEAALDEEARRSLPEQLAANSAQATIVFATHDVEYSASLAQRALVLDRGRLRGELGVPARGGAALLRDWYFALLGAPAATGRVDRMRPASRAPAPHIAGDARPADGIKRSIAQTAAIAFKDLRLELRTRESVPTMVVLTMMMLLAFNLAFLVPPQDQPALAAGTLWASMTFAVVIGVQRAYTLEHDRGTVETLLLAPIPRPAIYAAKCLTNFAFLTLVGVIAGLGVGFLFNVQVLKWEMLALILLGAGAFSAAGSLYGALITNVRARELLIPVLLLPVSLPVLMAGVSATLQYVGVTGLQDGLPWMGLLAAFCAIFVGVGMILFEHVFEG